MPVTNRRTTTLSAGAVVLAALAFLGMAAYNAGILGNVHDVGGPGTTTNVGNARIEGNLHVDRNASVSGTLDVIGATTLTSLTATGSTKLNALRLTGPTNSESTMTATQFVSTVGTGNAPLVVTSNTLVP